MGCCLTIQQGTEGIIEQFGRFDRIASPGLHFINPCCGTSLAGTVSLRVQQLDVRVETKTKDNVFVYVEVSVQFQTMAEKAYDAFYKLTDKKQQITSYVFDVVRATVPKIDLDDVFTTKEELAEAVRIALEKELESFGLQIIQTLVTDIDPDKNVKASMNDINAAQRMRVAAKDKAEAEKIAIVKAAEADAESKYLAGTGIARQRKAIVDGLRDSVTQFADVVEGTSPKDVMDLVLITQYFDTLKDLGLASRNSTIFVPHNPSSIADIQKSMRTGFGMQATNPVHAAALQVRKKKQKEAAKKIKSMYSQSNSKVNTSSNDSNNLPQKQTPNNNNIVIPQNNEINKNDLISFASSSSSSDSSSSSSDSD